MNTVKAMINFEGMLSNGVMPVDSPTVPNAEVVSKRFWKKRNTFG